MPIYTDSEKAWIERRARKIAKETGWPLPIARSEAMAELVRMRQRPKGAVLPLRDKSRVQDKNG